MRVLRSLTAVSLAAAVLASAGRPAAARQDPSAGSVEAFTARLGRYVARFEREFSSAVAEERYVQLVRPISGRPSWPSAQPALEWYEGTGRFPFVGRIYERRQLLSDVALVQTPQGWVGYRDVATVDGRPVRGRAERLSKLFASGGANRVSELRRIAEESARFNLGRFARTLNVPTLTLSFLAAAHHPRFAFALQGREPIGDRDTEVAAFEEHARPTLIGTSRGKDVPLSGRVWMDVATGAVVRTELAVVVDERRVNVLTHYRADPGWAVLVPDYMWEWYDSTSMTVVECLARYANYRRFGVEARIK